MAEESILKDQTEKKIDSALKKAYSGSHLAMRAGIYAAYSSQSLISDFKELFKSIQEGTEFSSLLLSH